MEAARKIRQVTKLKQEYYILYYTESLCLGCGHGPKIQMPSNQLKELWPETPTAIERTWPTRRLPNWQSRTPEVLDCAGKPCRYSRWTKATQRFDKASGTVRNHVHG